MFIPPATRTLRHRYLSAATLLLAVSGAQGWAQTAAQPGMPSSSLAEPSAASGTTPALPNAPSPKPAPGAAERALSLPRNFRITPAASRSNLPGKVSYYLGSTWSPRILLETLAVSGLPSLTTPPALPLAPTTGDPGAAMQYQAALNNYADAVDNWVSVNETILRDRGRRAAVGLATAESRQLLSNLVLPIALHQQARYIPAPVNSDFSQRMVNAAESIVLTRNDAGDLVPNYSKLGGTVGAAFLGKSFYATAFKAPELDSGHFALHYIAYSLLGDLATNTAHELIRAAVEPDLTMYGLHGRATDDSYYPLSVGGKVIYWARSTYAPRNFVTAFLITGLPATHHRPKGPQRDQPDTWNGYPDYTTAEDNYGSNTLAWKDTEEANFRYHGRRLIGGIAEAESQATLENLVIPVLFDMDPRYVPLGQGYTVGQRLGHAFAGLAVSHTDAGTRTVNLPVLGGTVGAAYLAKELYYPQLGTPALQTNRVLATTIGLNFAADAMYNVIGEFFRHRGY